MTKSDHLASAVNVGEALLNALGIPLGDGVCKVTVEIEAGNLVNVCIEKEVRVSTMEEFAKTVSNYQLVPKDDPLETGGGTEAQVTAFERGMHDQMIQDYDERNQI